MLFMSWFAGKVMFMDWLWLERKKKIVKQNKSYACIIWLRVVCLDQPALSLMKVHSMGWVMRKYNNNNNNNNNNDNKF